MPSTDEQIALLRNIYANRAPVLDDINRVAPWHALYRRRTLLNISKLELEGKDVIDLACGTGIFGAAIATSVRTLTLVDALPLMIDISKEKLSQHNNVIYINQDIETFCNMPQGKYDVVIMTQALNFLSDPAFIFSYVKSILKPHGVMYFDIDTRFRWSVIETLTGRVKNALDIAVKSRDVGRNIVGANYYFYSADFLRSCLKSVALDIEYEVGICHVSGLVHVLNQSSDFLDERLLVPNAKHFLDVDAMENLDRLDSAFAFLPGEAAGWLAIKAIKRNL